MGTSTLLLVRNGQTPWNVEHRFLGWCDVGLTDAGRAEAAQGGRLLRERNAVPDVVHTSLQQRGIRTAELMLEHAERSWIPVRRDWRLNERHYGILQGREETVARSAYGDAEVTAWRTEPDNAPPPIADDDEHSQARDPRYKEIRVPRTESLNAARDRVLAYFEQAVVPDLRQGTVLIATHGNPLRALVAHLAGVDHAEIRDLNVPGGTAIAYRLDVDTLKPVEPPYLVDARSSPLTLP
ncbi:2,3-bisphosphoglycerate-dependent phosphoglycerate mutase [Kribbella sp. GL6]|uniref:2,3-bisphosphoglycerate-dependent phosphoglycerate mutase n=1 Tax=Kribbella sp. GL6 TaxID=3419765 RepID=UPI003D0901B6